MCCRTLKIRLLERLRKDQRGDGFQRHPRIRGFLALSILFGLLALGGGFLDVFLDGLDTTSVILMLLGAITLYVWHEEDRAVAWYDKQIEELVAKLSAIRDADVD